MMQWGVVDARLVALAIAVVLGAVGSAASAGPVAVTAASVHGKKKCKIVEKRVHGHIKRVRVCTKPKPKPVAPAQLAARLAAGIDSAHTDATRYDAILRVMSAIKLGVYDGKTGKALAKGLDTNRYDAYLLGGEVRGIAAALGDAKSFSTADLASLLSLVLGRKTNPVPVQAANGLVSGLVQVALANPKNAASLVPLLVRDLGLAQKNPVDLARATGADPVPLDAAQLELIEAYLLYPIIHRGSQRHSALLRRPAARATAVCKVLKYAINHFNPNSYLDSEHAVHVVTDTAVPTAVTEVATAILEKLKFVATATTLEALDLVFTMVSGVHGSLLALSIELKSGPPLNQGTAYGHSGIPGQGNPMHFRVQAVYHEVLSPEDAECLSQMGFDMPEATSVAGMDIAWSEEDTSGKPLDEHGTLEFDLPGEFANGRTNESGVSTINFTPKDEVVPGVGRFVTDTGGEVPRALWGFKFKNPLGSITQVLFPLLGPELRWTVQYHEQNFELNFDSTTTYDFGGLGKDVDHVRIRGLTLNAHNSWTNEAPLDSVSVEVHPGDCGAPSISTRSGEPFKAKLLPGSSGNPPTISMNVWPGGVIDILDWDCPPPAPPQHLETALWTGAFLLLHGAPPLTVNDWNFLGGPVIANRTYRLSKFNVSEVTTFELKLAPD